VDASSGAGIPSALAHLRERSTSRVRLRWVPQAGKPCSGRSQRQIEVAQPRATWGMTASARLARREAALAAWSATALSFRADAQTSVASACRRSASAPSRRVQASPSRAPLPAINDQTRRRRLRSQSNPPARDNRTSDAIANYRTASRTALRSIQRERGPNQCSRCLSIRLRDNQNEANAGVGGQARFRRRSIRL